MLYGKTIDHVLEQQVVLVGRIARAFPAARPATSSTNCARASRSKARAIARSGARLGRHADEIERRYPKVLRRVGGYNLDALRRSAARAIQLAKLIVGSEGTLGVVVEAKIALVPLPKFKAVLAIQFADLLEALEATPGDPRASTVGDRGDGSVHPRPHQAERRA